MTVEHGRFAGAGEVREALAKHARHRGRHQRFHVHANGLGRRVAEEGLGGRVPQHDPAAAQVGSNDGVAEELEQARAGLREAGGRRVVFAG